MGIQKQIVDSIIQKIILGQNYRIEIQKLINAEFLKYIMSFFQEVAKAKINNQIVDIQWYKNTFLNPDQKTNDIAIHSGLNKKSISNMYKSAHKKVVIDAAHENIDSLLGLIDQLSSNQDHIDIELTIRFRGISVHLNISESLLVMNTIAVKRASIRGSLWSSLGKNVEKKLMITLCDLFNVPKNHYKIKNIDQREVDFYFLDLNDHQYRCEIKLMGKGNPESADSAIARHSDIFIADTLSNLNKKQLDSLSIHWIELSQNQGYLKFNPIFQQLNIPYQKISHITSHQILKTLCKIQP